MTGNEATIDSPIVSAMGAKITITGPARSMYLVIGHNPLESLVRGAGGEVVLRLNGKKMLATLPFTGYLSLKGSREISHIGPVTVDIKRLTKVAEMLAKTGQTSTNHTI